SNPSAGYLYRVSETFRQSNGNLGEVLKAILLDYEARSLVLADSAVGHGRMKEPLVHFMGLLRALNAYSNIPLTTLKDAPTPFSTGESPLTTPYPQSEIDKFQSLSPATWTEPTRFRFGDYTSVLGQSTLAAPSVFNWFLPDYTVPGTLAEAGLVSPEFQIATETNVVNRVNRLYSFALAALAGTTTYPGVDVDAPISITTSAAPEVKVSTALPGAATASTFLPEQTFVFNTSNWSTPRTVTVAAADDRRVEGNHTTQIRHSSTSSDIAYSNRTFDELTVNITDNEANGNARVILTESGGETLVVEGGGAGPASDTYDLVLGSAPSADVTIQITPAITYFGVNTTDVTVSPTSVTFTPGNWATPQTVTVTAVNDTHSEGPEIGLVSHVIQSADPVYAAVSAPSLNAIVGDNDNNGTYTVSVLQSANQTLVLEGGATDSYRVALRRQPTANVTMAINAGSQLTTAPTSLTFTTADWYVPKTVTVTAVDDAAVEGRHTQQISNAFSGGGYSVSNNFNATIEDNDGGSLIIAETSGSTDVTENFAGVPSGSNPILPSAALDSYTIRLGTAPTSDVTVTVAPERNPSKTSLWSKQAGYFLGDMNNNNSDQQKERIVLNYDFLINLYATTFAAMPGISGTPTNAQKQAAHFAATTAVVDKLDLLLAGGRLKAVGGSLALVDLNNTAIINPRKSIIAAVYSGYSTTRGNKVTDEPAFTNEIKARVRIAGYLVAISPASFISK
ncbi:MAG: DUF1800 family protein, partial [Verrucomicrobiales bacterium]|nr:DUF1800 family protein [Verrucomicrobiales bacterium]